MEAQSASNESAAAPTAAPVNLNPTRVRTDYGPIHECIAAIQADPDINCVAEYAAVSSDGTVHQSGHTPEPYDLSVAATLVVSVWAGGGGNVIVDDSRMARWLPLRRQLHRPRADVRLGQTGIEAPTSAPELVAKLRGMLGVVDPIVLPVEGLDDWMVAQLDSGSLSHGRLWGAVVVALSKHDNRLLRRLIDERSSLDELSGHYELVSLSDVDYDTARRIIDDNYLLDEIKDGYDLLDKDDVERTIRNACNEIETAIGEIRDSVGVY